MTTVKDSPGPTSLAQLGSEDRRLLEVLVRYAECLAAERPQSRSS